MNQASDKHCFDAPWSRLPHRSPLLVVDRVLEMKSGTEIVAQKQVTASEPLFWSCIENCAISNVLLVEMIAQVGGILLLDDPRAPVPNSIMALSAIERATFSGEVKVGELLQIKVSILGRRMDAARMVGKVSIDKRVCCRATLMCQLVKIK